MGRPFGGCVARPPVALLPLLLVLLLAGEGTLAFYMVVPAAPVGTSTTACRKSTYSGQTDHWFFNELLISGGNANSNKNFDKDGTVPFGTYTSSQFKQGLCTGSIPDSLAFPGSFCFYQSFRNPSSGDWCPSGFEKGSRTHTISPSAAFGFSCGTNECQLNYPRAASWTHKIFTITAYVAGQIFFCCRNDPGALGTTVNHDHLRPYMPDQFSFMRKGGSCQAIYGRTVSAGWAKIDDYSSLTNQNGQATSGSIPDGTYNSDYTQYRYCVYGPSTVPYPVSNIALSTRTSTSISLTWTVAATTVYQNVYVRSSGSQNVLVAQHLATIGSYTLNSLSPGTSYTITIYAGNSNRVYEQVGTQFTVSTCPAGYTGANCQTPVCNPACVKGTCTAPNTCQCQTGYTGATCNQCGTGFFPQGGSCAACPSCQRGYCSDGNTGTGQCICNPGWTGTLCNMCAPGYYLSGNQCLACPSTCAECTSATTCQKCVAPALLSNNMCVTQCGTNAYPSGTACLPCVSPCLTCHNMTACTSCDSAGLVLEGTVCAGTCNVRRYPDANRVCRDCNARCYSCSGPSMSECSACVSGYVLQGSTCVTTVDCQTSGGYVPPGTSTCQACDQSCARCHGGTASDCTACPAGKVLQNGMCKSECDPGYAADASGTCYLCIAPCATCTGLTSSSCTSCQAGLALYGSTCVAQCPAGTFLNGAVCSPCDDACATCTGGSATNCTSCADVDRVLHHGECISSCPSTHYADAARVCRQCAQACSTCEGSASYCTSCSGEGSFPFEGECLSSCPAGMYQANSTCLACDESCATCNGAGSTSCVTCPGNFVNYNGECLSRQACTSTARYVTEDSLCVDCDSTCASCSGSPSTCTSCTAPRFLAAATCVESCPNGQYGEPSDRTCRACTSPCGNCTSTTSCLSCVSGLVLDGTVCRTSCPRYTFASSGVCQPCDESCDACNGINPNNCLSCRHAYAQLNNENVCEVKCEPTQYWDGTDCQDCSVAAGCAQCTSAEYCTACLDTNLVASGGDCIAACPDGTVNVNGRCVACDGTCATCNALGASNCTSCGTGYYLSDGQCITAVQCTAKQGFASAGVCQPCHSSCLTCSGAGESACTSCVNAAHVVSAGKCQTSCAPGTYAPAPGTVCKACQSPCGNCRSASECTSCTGGRLLSGTSCVLNCPQGTWRDADAGVCAPCADPSCISCSDGGLTSCQMCSAPKLLRGGRCLEACDAGTHPAAVGSLKFCLDCPGRCSTCSSGNTCTGCFNDTFVLLDGQCVTTCPDDHYVSAGLCLPCDDMCESCYADGPNACMSCDASKDRYLLGNTCISAAACHAQGSYADSVQGRCLPCDLSCTSCSTGGESGCTACTRADYVLQSGRCQPTCDDGFYASGSECLPCSANCARCVTSNTTCTACPQGLYLYNNRCGACPSSHFPDQNGVCQPCASTCGACFGPSASQCVSCPNSTLVLDGGYCREQCSPGSLEVGGICRSCNALCLTCGGSLDNCLACASPTAVLHQGTCLGECPLGYSSTPERVCALCDSSCSTCIDSTVAGCLTCADTRELHIRNQTVGSGTCDCPVGSFSAPNTTAYQEAFRRGICLDCTVLEGGCMGLLASTSNEYVALAVAVPLSGLLLVLVLCFFIARAYPRSDAYQIIFALTILYAMGTSIYLCVSLFAISSLYELFLASAISIGASWLFNMCCVVYVFNRAAYKSPYILRYFETHLFATAVIGLFSTLAVELLTLLGSRLFNWNFCTLTWPYGMERRIANMGLGVLFFLNVPFLVIEIMVIQSVGTSFVVVLALGATCASIVACVARRVAFAIADNKARAATKSFSAEETFTSATLKRGVNLGDMPPSGSPPGTPPMINLTS